MTLLTELAFGLKSFSVGTKDGDPSWPIYGIGEVVVAGSSGTGKTTFVNAIRNCPLATSGFVSVPKRYITRPRRENDDLVENEHVSLAVFDALRSTGKIGLCWRRRFSKSRVERYGFSSEEGGLVVVYSGNNALARSILLKQGGSLKRAIVLGLHASTDVRLARFSQRNPSLVLDGEEMAHRFGEAESAAFEFSHLVIHADKVDKVELEHEAVEFIRRLVVRRRAALGADPSI